MHPYMLEISLREKLKGADAKGPRRHQIKITTNKQIIAPKDLWGRHGSLHTLLAPLLTDACQEEFESEDRITLRSPHVAALLSPVNNV